MVDPAGIRTRDLVSTMMEFQLGAFVTALRPGSGCGMRARRGPRRQRGGGVNAGYRRTGLYRSGRVGPIEPVLPEAGMNSNLTPWGLPMESACIRRGLPSAAHFQKEVAETTRL